MRVAIIGAGASGCVAGIKAREKGFETVIFEKNEIVAKKILATGNGKCNFTNKKMGSSYFFSDDNEFVQSILERFSNEDLLYFLTRLGLVMKEKNGYFYPLSEQASTVQKLLLDELVTMGADIRTNTFVNHIEKVNDKFLVSVEGEKERQEFDRVILCNGGMAGIGNTKKYNGIKLIENFGVKIKNPMPSLTRLMCDGLDFDALKGVRTEAKLSFFIDETLIRSDVGELLFTDHGISGIVVFQGSHLCIEALLQGKTVNVLIDCLPNMSEKNLEDMVISRMLLHPEKKLKDFFTGILNDKLNDELIRLSGLDENQTVEKTDRNEIIEAVRNAKFLNVRVVGYDDFKDSQVMSGGVLTSELSENLEVKSVKGLYVCGELINVDGICGGYNLQWAFSTGAIAGEDL